MARVLISESSESKNKCQTKYETAQLEGHTVTNNLLTESIIMTPLKACGNAGLRLLLSSAMFKFHTDTETSSHQPKDR